MKEEVHRNFKGIWIPREIWLSDKLTIGEKVMLAEIDSLEDEQKGCYCSNKYLGEFFNLSADRVKDIISNLVKKGFVENNAKKGEKLPEQRVLRVVHDWGGGAKTPIGGGRKRPMGGVENALYIKKVITKNITNPMGSALFSEFWEEYPPTRKQDRMKCLSVWVKYSDEEHKDILADVKKRKVEHNDWVKDNQKYVPAPLVYLRNRRWEAPMVKLDEKEKSPGGVIINSDGTYNFI